MEELPQPILKKQKMPWWKKLMVFLPIIFLATWGLAMWNPLEGNDGQQNDQGKFEVEGYTFYELNDSTFGTYIYANNQQIPIQFRLDPRNASSISMEEDAPQKLMNISKVYITFDPNQQDIGKVAVAAAELSRITGLYHIETIGAYTQDSNPVNPNVPIRTCEDATNKTTVVLLNITNGTASEITTDEYCVHLNAPTADDLIFVADKLGMNMLGINL